ncbi:MAG: hypothetical protein AAF125_01660 [Chloroflexota bacterium]
MQNYTNKSVPLLISKLRTSIMASERSRGDMDMWRRREEIKDELGTRGAGVVTPLLDLLHHPDTAPHAAEVIGRVGTDETVIDLAKLLAGAYPHYTKRAVAKALKGINTPDAVLAVNIWAGRLGKVREQVQAFVVSGTASEDLQASLATLAARHNVTTERVAEAYLLATTDEILSLDAQARLRSLPLSADECAVIDAIVAP